METVWKEASKDGKFTRKKKKSFAEQTEYIKVGIVTKKRQLFELYALKDEDGEATHDFDSAVRAVASMMLETRHKVKILCNDVKKKLDKVLEDARRREQVDKEAIGHRVFVENMLECYEAKMVSELNIIM